MVVQPRQRRSAALKSDNPSAQAAHPSGTELRHISIDSIVRAGRRARRSVGDVAALAESIQDYNLLHPISVRAEGGRYILTAGERRLEAVRLLGWPTIPAFIRELDTDKAYIVELIENLQRENLSPEDEADALTELVRTRGWTLEQVAAALKRSVAFVSKRVRVFEDPVLREAVVAGRLNVSTAEELLAARPEHRAPLVASAIEQRWDHATAREALKRHGPAAPAAIPIGPSEQHTPAAIGPAQQRTPAVMPPLTPNFRPENSSTRPAGFTQTVREFHGVIMDVKPEDLNDADRGALRALFRDLVLLARAPTHPRAPVFPALPVVKPAPQAKRRRA